jgi:ABC-type transport system substrate-binding protein
MPLPPQPRASRVPFLADKEIAEAAAAMLGQAGVRVRLVPTERAKIQKDLQAATFDGITAGQWGTIAESEIMVLMLTIQKCERAGIKTTLVYNDVGEGPDDPGFIFAVPEADAIVNSGWRNAKVTLPALQTIIGGESLIAPEMDARKELTVPLRYLHGAVDPMGHSRLTVRFE